MATVLSLTETQTFAALRSVLNGFGLLSSTQGETVPVIRGQANRVPEPSLPDYVVMWPLRRDRLSTDIDTYQDNIVTGSISANVLTVTAVTRGIAAAGQMIYGVGVTAGCQIVRQISGVPGGSGTYATTPTANVGSISLYLGTVSLLQPVDVVIQCDVHGPASADNAHIISTLIRDYVGAQAFADQGPGLVPLYTDDPRQIPFINGEAQYEERWIVDVHLQADPLVIVSQQFADQLHATAISVEAAYPVVQRPDFWNDGGVLVMFQFNGYPSSPSGLLPGAIWRDDLTIAVVFGHTPDPSAPPVYFGQITASQLLALGGGNLPLSNPGIGSLQLYNNGGLVCVA